MSDPLLPRVHLALPGGRVEARLLRWQQQDDGTWRAEVALTVPAGAVQQVDGEDYSGVPRRPAGLRYVLSTDTRAEARDEQPAMQLHVEGHCFVIAKAAAWRRITPCPDPAAALKFPDTTACTACRPEP